MKPLDAIEFAPRRQSLGDRAYKLIKEDIVVCRLRPGAEVTEAGLVKHYKIGLAPIRAALSRLTHDELVNAVPRHGYIIAPITIQSVKDIFDLRLLLEPAAARAAAGRAEPEILRRLSSGPFDRSNDAAGLQFLRDNRSFHVEIARMSGNQRMARILSSVLDEMARLLHLGLFSNRDADAVRTDHEHQRTQHKELVDALVAGDAEGAEKAARQHVEHSRGLVTQAVMRGAFSANL